MKQHVVTDFEEIVQKMASCEQLGKYYTVEKGKVERKKVGFFTTKTEYEDCFVLTVYDDNELEEGADHEEGGNGEGQESSS